MPQASVTHQSTSRRDLSEMHISPLIPIQDTRLGAHIVVDQEVDADLGSAGPLRVGLGIAVPDELALEDELGVYSESAGPAGVGRLATVRAAARHLHLSTVMAVWYATSAGINEGRNGVTGDYTQAGQEAQAEVIMHQVCIWHHASGDLTSPAMLEWRSPTRPRNVAPRRG